MRKARGILTIAGGVLGTLAGVALALVASSAAAGPDSRVITIFGDSANAITIRGSQSSEAITLRGSTKIITVVGENLTESREECNQPSGAGTEVYCALRGIETMAVSLRKGRDTFAIENRLPVQITVNGGDAEDELFGFDLAETLIGGDQDDRIFGGRGKDTIDGGRGVDRCEGEEGLDALTNCERGGAGQGPARR